MHGNSNIYILKKAEGTSVLAFFLSASDQNTVKYDVIMWPVVPLRNFSTKRLGNYTVIGLESRGVSKIDVCVPLWQVFALGPFGSCLISNCEFLP